jgi:hypothetical protein
MRVKRAIFTVQVLADLFKSRRPFRLRLLGTPLPDDARIVRMYDALDGRYVVVIESDSFDLVPDGEVIPLLDLPHVEVLSEKILT